MLLNKYFYIINYAVDGNTNTYVNLNGGVEQLTIKESVKYDSTADGMILVLSSYDPYQMKIYIID